VTLYSAEGTVLNSADMQFFRERGDIAVTDEKGNSVGFVNPAAQDGSIAVTNAQGVFAYLKPPGAQAPPQPVTDAGGDSAASPPHANADAQAAADAAKNTGQTVGASGGDGDGLLTPDWASDASPTPPPSAPDPDGVLAPALKSKQPIRLGPVELERPAIANEERVLRELSAGGDPEPDAGEEPFTVLAGSSERLAGPAKAYVEKFFSRSFGDVRIHRDAAAERAAQGLDAHAFTVGKDIYFGAREFTPGDPKSMALLVHELTHVVQQQQGIARKAIAGVGADALALETMWRVDGPIQARQRFGVSASVSASGSINFGVRTAPAASRPQAPTQASSAAQAVSAGPGRPLDFHERQELEAHIGTDLSQVRVHESSAAQSAASQQGAQAFQSGLNIVLGGQAAQKSPEGTNPTLAHEAEHVRQQQAGETQAARRNPFAQWMLEQSAKAVEGALPAVAKGIASGLGNLLHAPGLTGAAAAAGSAVAGQVAGLVGRFLGSEGAEHLHPPAHPAPGQGGAHPAPGQPGKGKGPKPPGEQAGEETHRSSENYIHELMAYYGVRPHVGEEEFLDELTDRVKDLMNEEVLIESERRSLSAPF
jgi:hypothetical protein